MRILPESLWYNEIVKEGFQKGFELGYAQGLVQGQRQVLKYIIRHRFGKVGEMLELLVGQIELEQMQAALKIALDSTSLAETSQLIAQLFKPSKKMRAGRTMKTNEKAVLNGKVSKNQCKQTATDPIS